MLEIVIPTWTKPCKWCLCQDQNGKDSVEFLPGDQKRTQRLSQENLANCTVRDRDRLISPWQQQVPCATPLAPTTTFSTLVVSSTLWYYGYQVGVSSYCWAISLKLNARTNGERSNLRSTSCTNDRQRSLQSTGMSSDFLNMQPSVLLRPFFI